MYQYFQMSQTNKDYYEMLGVQDNSSSTDIKRAYRKLSMKYHPDRNPGNDEMLKKTQEINEAYEILGDENKREQYDISRHNPFVPNNHNMDININDLFGSLFSRGPDIYNMSEGFDSNMQNMPNMPKIKIVRSNMNHTGANSHIHSIFNNIPQMMSKPIPIVKNINVNISQILQDTTIPIEIERWIMENNTKIFECETLYIDIPQGVDDNEIIILKERGNVLNDANKGDVKIFVKVINDTPFRRNGLDLILEKDISLKESLCGFSFELHHINGKSYTLNNNKGNIITPNYQKSMPKMGISRREHVGNMIIQFNIIYPSTLSIEQIKILNEIL